jgi:predicted DNA-binding transcriptional regulator AlpA
MEKPSPVSETVSKDQLIPPRHLCRALGISRRTLRRWVESKLFPAPIRLGPHGQTLRWAPSEVVGFLEAAAEMGSAKPKANNPKPKRERRRKKAT